jgi:DnaJ-domain-containing protein 1
MSKKIASSAQGRARKDLEVLDLTGNSDDESPPASRLRSIFAAFSNEAIGVDMSFDIVDLADSDNSDNDVPFAALQNAMIQSLTKQTHPSKIRAESRKRRRDRKAALEAEAAKKKKIIDEEAHLRQPSPGGCNFILIDDSSDDDDIIVVEDRKPAAKRKRSGPEIYKNIKTQTQVKSSQSFNHDIGYNFYMSQDDAAALQDRMLRESAERLMAQVSLDVGRRSEVPLICHPMLDIAQQYPEHWTWNEPYSCLGLPLKADFILVKKHYRALARCYHPDKSKQANTSNKFHGIARAYRKLAAQELT